MKRYAELTRQERVAHLINLRRADLALVLENLAEDLNISAILRTTEALGVGQVFIIHPKGKKPKLSMSASSGAAKWLNVKYYSSIKICLNLLKKSGFKVVAAAVDPTLPGLWDSKFLGKVAVVVGNEASGLSEEAKKLADQKVYLPMYGLTESLNVSVAAALFLYEVIRQKEVRR